MYKVSIRADYPHADINNWPAHRIFMSSCLLVYVSEEARDMGRSYSN